MPPDAVRYVIAWHGAGSSAWLTYTDNTTKQPTTFSPRESPAYFNDVVYFIETEAEAELLLSPESESFVGSENPVAITSDLAHKWLGWDTVSS